MSVTSRFEDIEEAESYDTLHSYKRFFKDESPDKINLKTITFREEDGKPRTLPVIQRVQLLSGSNDCLKNSYLPGVGLASFNKSVMKLLLGKSSRAILENKIICIQTLTSVTSIWIAAKFILKHLHYDTLYLSTPHSRNIRRVFEFAGFKNIRCYRYWSTEKSCLDFDGMKDDLEFAPRNSVIFLHGLAHNPTSYDLSCAQWAQLADLIVAHGLYPFFYCDNLGLVSGRVADDAHAIRLFLDRNIELICVQDLELDFCLYSDRVGSLMLYTLDSSTSLNVESTLTKIAIALYSSPATNVARIISYILNCEQFTAVWENDLRDMAARIKKMREILRSALELMDTPGDWSVITEQNGIYAYIPFTETQIIHLMDVYHIYVEGDGRFNVTAINSNNVNTIAAAFKDTLINIR